MENIIKEQLCKEYGLSLLGYMLEELLKIPGFDRLAVVKHANDFLTGESKKSAAALAADETTRAAYAATKARLDALLPEKRERLIVLLDIENLSASLSGE